MNKQLKTLICEDSIIDAESIIRYLQKQGGTLNYKIISNREDFIKELDFGWDVIISNYTLPDFNVSEVLKILQERKSDIPVIVVSATMGEEAAVEIMQAGAKDCILKDKLIRLMPIIQRELKEVEEQKSKTIEATHRERLFSFSPNLIAVVTLSGVVEQVNTAWKRVLGWTPEDLVGNSFLNIVYPDDRITSREMMGGQMVEFETRILTRDGGYKWISWNSEIDDTLKVIYKYGRDVTAFKQNEVHIQDNINRLNVLHNLDIAISNSLNVEVTMGVLAEQVVRQIGADATDAFILHSATNDLEFIRGVGFKTSIRNKFRIRPGDGYTGKIAIKREVVYVPDLEAGGDIFPHILDFPSEGFVSYFGVPLIAKSEVKGVLEIFFRQQRESDPEWIDFMETLAGQTAMAIDNLEMINDIQRSNAELQISYDNTLDGWAKALDVRNHESESHTRTVTQLSLRVAKVLGVKDEMMINIRRGALLHDIGKLGVPESIILKPGPLTDEEWVVMKRHPVMAFNIMAPVDFLRPAVEIPYCHHERWDGMGYPRGLKGENIPIEARIFAIANVWDSLRNDKPFRKAWPEDKIREYMLSEKGKYFDPSILEIFMNTDWGIE